MHEQCGAGVETVLSDEEQALKSLAWQKGYTLGITVAEADEHTVLDNWEDA